MALEEMDETEGAVGVVSATLTFPDSVLWASVCDGAARADPFVDAFWFVTA